MEMANAATFQFHGRYDDEFFVQELLDDEVSHLFLHPQSDDIIPLPITSLASTSSKEALNRLVSGVYSGPRIQDVEEALSKTDRHNQRDQLEQTRSQLSFLRRGLNDKIENKYTLKIKCCSNGAADDGYKWRKYGQKSIKNSPHPRSYYKCTNPRCSAKKQVERSGEDPDTLVITYEGLHLHFTYPYFQHDPTQQQPEPDPPTKRPKRADEAEREAQQGPNTTPELGSDEGFVPQGLLEDVVPLMIRNPSPWPKYVSSNDSSSSCSPYHSQSPPTSPSSLSWSPDFPHVLI